MWSGRGLRGRGLSWPVWSGRGVAGSRRPRVADTEKGEGDLRLSGASPSPVGGGYLLSHSRSTIGVAGLNFSVRDGKRWNPRAIAAFVRLSARGNAPARPRKEGARPAAVMAEDTDRERANNACSLGFESTLRRLARRSSLCAPLHATAPEPARGTGHGKLSGD